jgi:ectoine hydroxylase-related dioxygenase (phytanoyl-CoA dioxygenase family)
MAHRPLEATMRELTESTDLLPDWSAVRGRLAAEGYVYFRRLVPSADVVRGLIATVLVDCRWLAPATDPDELVASELAVGEGEKGFHGMYTAVQMLQEVHEFALSSTLLSLAGGVLDEPVFCHPMHIFRITPPASRATSTPAHQDYRLIQGSADTLTTWIPLADTPATAGGLRVLAGSHRLGVLPVREHAGPGGQALDVADDDPRWRSTTFTAGDVLMFSSLTAHAAVPNVSDRFRMSADFRYQAVTDPVARRPDGFTPHYHPAVPHWRTLTRGWTSTHSVEAPAGLAELERFDYHAPDVPTPPSRFVTAPPTSQV